MTDATPSANSDSAATQPKSGGNILRIVLFVVLGILVVLWIYDFLIARPSSNKAFDTVLAMVEDRSTQETPEDVHQALGKSPAGGLEDQGDYYTETYHWRRGTLAQTYYVTVLYEKLANGDAVLYEVVKNVEPTANDIPNPPVTVPPPEDDSPATNDATDDENPESSDPTTEPMPEDPDAPPVPE